LLLFKLLGLSESVEMLHGILPAPSAADFTHEPTEIYHRQMVRRNQLAAHSPPQKLPTAGAADRDPLARERRACAGVVAAASFLLYALTVCPTVPPGDGGELVTASVRLGVAHPPGYPLYTALGWLVTRTALVEPALAMNLLSAVLAGICCGALAWLLHRLTGRREAALGGALAFAGSSSFWSSANVAEVYPLHLLLMALLLCFAWMSASAADERQRTRALLLAGLTLGAGLSHHPTIVLAIPAAAVLAWPLPQRHERKGAWGRGRVRDLALSAALVLAVPFVSYGWMLLRGKREFQANWGHRDSLQQIWTHITAMDYRRYDLGWAGLLRGDRWLWVGRHLWTELTPVALPLALFGLAAALRARGALRRLAVAALLLGGAHAAFGLRYSVEDAETYLIPVWLGMACLVALGIERLGRLPWRRARLAAVAAAVLVLAAPAVTHFGRCSMRGVTAAADFGRDVLASVGPRAALVIESDQAFPVFYLHLVMHQRPDIAIYGRWGLLGRDMGSEAVRLSGGRFVPQNYTQAELGFIDAALASHQYGAVHFMANPGYPAPSGYRMEPSGLTWRVVPAAAPPLPDDFFWRATHEAAVRAQAQEKRSHYLIGLAAAYPSARGSLDASRGLLDRAAAEFDAAGAVAGDDDVMTHMRIGILQASVLHDPARAIKSFEHAIALQPTSFESWNNLGRAKGMLGDRKGAGNAFRRSLALNPEQPEVRSMLQQVERSSP
jgi:hypothetical protein